MMTRSIALVCCGMGMAALSQLHGAPSLLRPGEANHAVDHFENVTGQADAAAACGADILYTPGLGTFGRDGFPNSDEWPKRQQAVHDYIRQARQKGFRLVFGEISATTFSSRESFDASWAADLRARLLRPPSSWRQQDSEGRPLPSGKGTNYEAACMNNPDWRTYVAAVARAQLQAGCDGICFEDLSVHPDGCYCPWCMEKFLRFLLREEKRPFQKSRFNILNVDTDPFPLAAARELARTRTNDFLRFRCALARDFLADMRVYARTVQPAALITGDNGIERSLFGQCRAAGRSIFDLSESEDLVLVEDMSPLLPTSSSDEFLELGPAFKQLGAISRGKPVVGGLPSASTNAASWGFTRLAMAEAAACNASALSFPDWPVNERERAVSALRSESDWLRANARYFSDAEARHDVVLFLPFEQWLDSDRCAVSPLAQALSRANVQYDVVAEDAFQTGIEARFLTKHWRIGSSSALPKLRNTSVLLAPSLSAFNSDEIKFIEKFIGSGGKVITADSVAWLMEVQQAVDPPSITLTGAPDVRAYVRDQKGRTLIHLLNLAAGRLPQLENQAPVVPNLQIICRVPFNQVRSVRALTPDDHGTKGDLAYATRVVHGATTVQFSVPSLEMASLVVIER